MWVWSDLVHVAETIFETQLLNEGTLTIPNLEGMNGKLITTGKMMKFVRSAVDIVLMEVDNP